MIVVSGSVHSNQAVIRTGPCDDPPVQGEALVRPLELPVGGTATYLAGVGADSGSIL